MIQIGPRGKNDQDKDFLHNSVMTLTLDLETRFKVAVHPSPKATLLVKFEPDMAMEKEKMHQTSDLGWTE